MANIIHPSKSRSHQQHHQPHQPHHVPQPTREAWPPYQKLLISTQNTVRLQDASSQNTLVKLDNVHSMSVATSPNTGCRVLVAHNDSILLRDDSKRKDTLYRLRGSAVSEAPLDKWPVLTDSSLKSPLSSSFQIPMSFCSGQSIPISYVAIPIPSTVLQTFPASIRVSRHTFQSRCMVAMLSVHRGGPPQCTCRTCAGRRLRFR